MTIQDRIGKYLAAGRSWNTRNVNTIKVFSVHHDAIPHDNRTADQVMQSIFGIHNGQKGWPGMSYHYYIHKDGGVYQVNKHEWVTWIDGINYDAIGIVLNGYFHPDVNNTPTAAQLKSLKELLDELSTNHPEFPAAQSNVFGHRERASTACPGDKVFPYVKEYREKNGNVNWGSAPAPTPTPTPTPTPPSGENWEQKFKDLDKAFNEYKEARAQEINKLNEEKNKLNDKINNAKNALG